MTNLNKRDQAEALYNELQQVYQSPYFATAEEKDQAVIILMRLILHGYDKPKMLAKLKALRVIHGPHKTKLTNLIHAEFLQDLAGFERAEVKKVSG